MGRIRANIKRRNHAKMIAITCVAVLLLACIGIGIYIFTLWKNGDRLNRETMFVAPKVTKVTLPQEAEPEGNEAEPAPTAADGKQTVRHNGKYYTYNENMIAILFMGIDVHSEDQFADVGVTAHQSDTLILLALEPETQNLSFINIPRMTIADVKQLDANFQYARTTQSPICIQFAFGDGKELSCELTRDAVSNLLYNIPISNYICMNLDGLYSANDAIGGVTLTLLDDMTAFNPEMEKGKEYTLLGEDAEIYLSRRLGEGLDGTNMSRTARHIQYYKAFFKKAKDQLKTDPLFALNLYNSMGSSVQTDLSVEEIIYLSKAVINMEIEDQNIHTLEGEVKNEDFLADDAAMKDLLIRVFYTEVTQ